MYVPYPKGIGVAWSIDGRLAVFATGQYNMRKINERSRKIKNSKELAQFMGSITVSGHEDQYEGREDTKSHYLSNNLKNASTVLRIGPFHGKMRGTGKSERFPQLFNKSTWEAKTDFITKKKSEEKSQAQKKCTVTLYQPSEKLVQEKSLAKMYKICEDDCYKECMDNASVCFHHNCIELAKAWNLLACSLKDLNHNVQKLKEWKDSPFGKEAFLELISHFLKYFSQN